MSRIYGTAKEAIKASMRLGRKTYCTDTPANFGRLNADCDGKEFESVFWQGDGEGELNWLVELSGINEW